jgi:hypothetical protein
LIFAASSYRLIVLREHFCGTRAIAEIKSITREALEAASTRILMAQPAMNYLFTRTQLESGNMPDTRIAKLVAWLLHRNRQSR